MKLPRSAVLIPGLVDCHVHMPQYAFTGTGMDLPLLQVLLAQREKKCAKSCEFAVF